MTDSVYRGVLVFENYKGEVKKVYGKVHNKPGPAKASATRILGRLPNIYGIIWMHHPKTHQFWDDTIDSHRNFNHPDDNYYFVSRHTEEATEWTKV